MPACQLPPPTVVDLFCGCGGLSLGLELVGFEPILAAELSKSARATYLRNRVDLDVDRVKSDVRSLARMETTELRRLAGLRDEQHPTLVTGGPPCQGFSGIGHRRTNSDVEKREIASNHLYRDMVQVIAKLQPDVFLFENVRGLLSSRWTRNRPDKVWDTVRLHFLKRLGGDYAIAFQVVHGYQFGVPQNRPRVLMIGLHRRHWPIVGFTKEHVRELRSALRAGEALGFESTLLPEPYPWPGFVPSPAELLGDLVDPDWETRFSDRRRLICHTYPGAATTDWQSAMRANEHSLGAGLPLLEHEFSRHSSGVKRRFKAAQGSEDLQAPKGLRTKKFAQRVLPEYWAAPPHITVASLPDDFIHYESARSLTVREWARLQGFPDWYLFEGPRTTGGHRRAGDVRSGDSVRETPKYTQIGNAVPVPLAAAIGWHVRQMLGIPNDAAHRSRWDTPLAKYLREKLQRIE